MRYLPTGIFDGQAEHARHFVGVGEFEASLSCFHDQDFVEDKLVLFQDKNAFSIAKLLRGELCAVVTQMMLFKYGGHV